MQELRFILLAVFSMFMPLNKYQNAKRAGEIGSSNVASESATVKSLSWKDVPVGYFGNVLDISPNTIVGNFGEPRKSHFHTGLDFRTNAEEGHSVFAAADGYVSRINVSGVGYGNALYITHPNGFVTVYGHLREFAAPIQKRLRTEQYAKENFTVDFYPNPNELVVKKGELVAKSGNTGGSGGPHLHFEIRDTFENVYNPMLFGYKLKDDLKPVVGFVKFYPLDSLKYKSDGYRLRPTLKEGIYEFSTGVVRLNASKIGFSINAYDVMNMTQSHTGIYNLAVFDGDKMVYDARFDKLTFPERRYVMSHIDYPIFMNEGRKSFHKCFIEPGNACCIYSGVMNAGEIDLSNGKEHSVHVEITDFNGNISQIKMKLKWDANATSFKSKNLPYTVRFDYDHDNEFSNAEFKIQVPKGCLFDNQFLKFTSAISSDTNCFSKVFKLGDEDVLSYDWMNVWVKAENLPASLREKAVVVVNGTTSLGGNFENGFIKARTRDFGSFVVKLDTIPPKIAALNVVTGKNMRTYKKILFKISDNLTGIADFDTYIDGKWVVTDYDGKSAVLTHTLDLSLPTGEHEFKVVVRDERKNETKYSIKFMM